jgi:hypothetical protein
MDDPHLKGLLLFSGTSGRRWRRIRTIGALVVALFVAICLLYVAQFAYYTHLIRVEADRIRESGEALVQDDLRVNRGSNAKIQSVKLAVHNSFSQLMDAEILNDGSVAQELWSRAESGDSRSYPFAFEFLDQNAGAFSQLSELLGRKSPAASQDALSATPIAPFYVEAECIARLVLYNGLRGIIEENSDSTTDSICGLLTIANALSESAVSPLELEVSLNCQTNAINLIEIAARSVGFSKTQQIRIDASLKRTKNLDVAHQYLEASCLVGLTNWRSLPIWRRMSPGNGPDEMYDFLQSTSRAMDACKLPLTKRVARLEELDAVQSEWNTPLPGWLNKKLEVWFPNDDFDGYRTSARWTAMNGNSIDQARIGFAAYRHFTEYKKWPSDSNALAPEFLVEVPNASDNAEKFEFYCGSRNFSSMGDVIVYSTRPSFVATPGYTYSRPNSIRILLPDGRLLNISCSHWAPFNLRRPSVNPFIDAPIPIPVREHHSPNGESI